MRQHIAIAAPNHAAVLVAHHAEGNEADLERAESASSLVEGYTHAVVKILGQRNSRLVVILFGDDDKIERRAILLDHCRN